MAPKLFDGVKPAFVVVALGANDSDPKKPHRRTVVLSFLNGAAPRVLAIPTNPAAGDYRSEANNFSVSFLDTSMTKDMMIDDVHYNGAGYRHWIRALTDAVAAECKPAVGRQDADAVPRGALRAHPSPD